MADNQDVLSAEDLLALHQTYLHLRETGDARAEKLRQYLVASGKQSQANPDATQTQFEQNGGKTGNERFADPIAENGVVARGTNFVRGAVNAVTSPILHPIETIEGMGKGIVAGGSTPYGAPITAPTGNQEIDAQNELTHRNAQQETMDAGARELKAHPGYVAGQFAGPVILGKAIESPAIRAGADNLVPKSVKTAVTAVANKRPLQGALAGKMAEVPPGEQFSRQEVVDAAKANNVNLDVAQATDSGAAQAIKKANQFSLTGQGAYEANSKSNLSALEDWANKEATKYAPESAGKEVVGGKLQQALKKHVDTLQNNATQIFNDLDRNVGNIKPDATSIYDKAKQIVAENADYYEKNPGLKQSRSWQILNDLADRAEKSQPTTSTVKSKIVDEGGQPFSKDVTHRPEVSPDTWTDLQKLRTDLMNEYRSPDIAGSRAEGWLKQLTATVDQSMTGAGSGLTGAELAKFRQANGIWEQLKNTYDNPQSPLYHALRAQAPSQIPGMLSKGTPELARQVRDTLGSLEGPFQRQFVENLLYAKDGQTLELGRLNQKLKGISNEHLEAMIGPEGAKNLRLLAKVSQKVVADANPSGTAKVGQPAAELAGVFTHPIAAVPELGAQYLGAKAINSPRVLEYLTRPKK